jgi:lipoprotein-anchoring transpeptidase ErfK/SrfK
VRCLTGGSPIGTSGGRGALRSSLVAATVSVLLVAGCGGGGSHDSATGRPASEGGTGAKAAAAGGSIAITPANGAHDVRPDTKVTVQAKAGTITSITVVGSDGTAVPGDVSVDSTTWTAGESLAPGSDYTVTAAVTDRRGRTSQARSVFSTFSVPESKQVKAGSIAPLDGSVVGVAQPLEVGFTSPVGNRAAAQQALQVQTVPEVGGAWYWIDSEHVHYRPHSFWPAGTKVTLHAKIAGVDLGAGRWGATSRTVSFTVGRPQVIRVDVKRLTMTVERDGKAVRRFQVTSGKPGWETRNGIKVVIDKEADKTWTNEAIDAPEHYRLHSDYAMRMTDSGEFIHDAPWSVGNLGRRSASHGCIGMYPSDARWLFQNTIPGDAVVITASPRPYNDLGNRYADWNVPWSTWSKGNA